MNPETKYHLYMKDINGTERNFFCRTRREVSDLLNDGQYPYTLEFSITGLNGAIGFDCPDPDPFIVSHLDEWVEEQPE